MADKLQARARVKEFLTSLGKDIPQRCETTLETLSTLSSQDFQNTVFPQALLDGCYYMGCTAGDFKNTTNPGLPLELFSDFCFSYVFCITGNKELIEQGHDTFRNYTIVQKREVSPRELCPTLPHNAGIEKDFYVVWTIYKRNDDAPTEFGPKYFSVLAMNGDVLGNYGVLFHFGKHKPLCLTLPTGAINWSSETFWQCNHTRPTAEVVRNMFLPQVTHLVNMFFGSTASQPEFLLTINPFENLGYNGDDFGSNNFYRNFMSFFPNKVLEIPANLCRNGAQGSINLYKAR